MFFIRIGTFLPEEFNQVRLALIGKALIVHKLDVSDLKPLIL